MTLAICRVCGSSENLKHVFREGNDELLDQIRLCANIQIDALDCLPKYVCYVCEQGLAFSYRLRKRGEETEKKLREELIATKSEPYSPVDETHEEDVSEVLIEESCDSQLWIKDDESVDFNQHEDLIENIEDSDEDILQVLPEERYDEQEHWISLQTECFNENNEIIKSEEIEKVEVDLIELMYDNNEITNELSQPETQIAQQVAKLELFPVDNFPSDNKDMRKPTSFSNLINNEGNHLKKDHTRMQCEKCAKTFKTVSQLNVHKKSHSNEKLYSCEICGKSMRYQGNLRVHIRTIHSKITVAELESRAQKINHRESQNNAQYLESMSEDCKAITTIFLHEKCKVYSCTVCGKISNFKASHIVHCRIHLNEKPFSCQVCGKSFRQLATLKEHEVIHSGTRPFKCSICSSSFLQKSALAKHMFWHTGRKPFECSICGTNFRNRVALRVHERIHTGEKPYSCDVCECKFREKRQVTRHRKLCHHHSQKDAKKEDEMFEKPTSYYHCTWKKCNKRFVLHLNLIFHLRRHLNPQDDGDIFKCEDCQKEFRKPIYMWHHQKIYKGTCAWRIKLKLKTTRIPIKYSICQTCCKLFVSPVALARHRRIHLSLRQHWCTKCHMKFRHRYSLNLHMRKHAVSQIEIVPAYDTDVMDLPLNSFQC